MKITVVPTPAGWQAADEDSLDGEIDADGSHHYSGFYAHGKTRKEALEGLRELYEERQEFPDDLEDQLDAALALQDIDALLATEKRRDEFTEFLKDVVRV